jgi:LemA protein
MAVSKRVIVAIVAVVIVVVAILAIVIVPYNSLVTKDQDVKNSWDDVKVEINRQMQLIPQLLSQQDIAMTYEQGLLTNITEMRMQWLNTVANASLNQQINFSQEFAVQFASFLSTTENYPNVEANQVIEQVTDELVGSQNRIAVAQLRYNDAVSAYNSEVRGFPGVLVSGMFGFGEATYYNEEL